MLSLLVGAALTACMPVTPSVEFEHTTFEGFPVISYVPEHPRGMVYVFHGSGGDAGFAEGTEMVDVLNLFIAAGYGFVSTESTDRAAPDKRWEVGSRSITANPDLARLIRLQNHLVATTGLDAATPLVGIGMSNGSRFVTLWGQAWADAGYPVKAIWAAAGRIAGPIKTSGGLDVPTFFTNFENDQTVDPQWTVDDYQATIANGTPALLRTSRERPLGTSQFLRIDGIDQAEAEGIVAAGKATGVWDGSGNRIVANIDLALARSRTAVLPPSVLADGLEGSVAVQTGVLLAAHNFSAEYKLDAFTFMDGFVSVAAPGGS
jgi:hypothetical protein